MLELRSLRQTWARWWKPISTKYQKLAWHGDLHLYSQLLKKLEWEDGLSPGSRGCSEPKIVPLHSSLDDIHIYFPKVGKASNPP